VALLVEAQYYLISDIYNGFLFLSLCIRRENERSELVSGASSQYRDWLGRAPFGFQEWEDPEKRKERAKKAVQLSRPMGVAAMALGIHPELLIVLGKMFHLQVILLSRQNGYDIDTFIKLETDTVYEALWSEVGRSVKAQGGELKSWVDTYFKRELSQETQSAIGSYGADAITLVRLGMKAGDVVEFGRMFCKREPNLLPNYERLSAMARAADIAAPFLKGVDRETMLRFKNDMEGLAESSRREAVREDAIRRGTS
jgi:hypothetical protein